MGLFSKFGKNKQESAQDSGYYTSGDDQAALERARSKRASSVDGQRRRTRDREADDPVLPEKKRARRRLVGAIALALAVAVGLPMVLDSEPKPLASDIDIKIPSKERAADAPAVRAPAPIPDSDALDSREEIVDDVKPDAKPGAAVAGKPVARPESGLSPQAQSHSDELDRSVAASEARAKAEADARNKQEADRRAEQERRREAERKLAAAKAEAKSEAEAKAKAREEAKAKADARAEADRKLADAKAAAKPAADSKQSQDARALAILEGKTAKPAPAAAAEAGQKFVLQVAALSDQNKVNELRERLKQAGISSYTQKAPSGDVTRVRVGPFSSKEEAEKVRAKLQGMGLAGRLETV